MAARIAELLFPAGQHRSQQEAYPAYTARAKLLYHKQVLVPLRACLDIPEVICYTPAHPNVSKERKEKVYGARRHYGSLCTQKQFWGASVSLLQCPECFE